MSGLVLTLRGAVAERVDASAIAPDRMARLSLGEVERLTLRFESGRVVAVGELFEVAGEKSDALRVVGDLSRVDGLGCRMAAGRLVVEGNAGRRLGARMTGGAIEVTGGVGDEAGLEMAGGRVVVRGSVGRRTGSAAPGARRGMTGGEIVVFGNAGAETGACLRRGVIAVAGNCGADVARGAIAGTVVVGGAIEGAAGRWSKRGSVVALGEVAVAATYRYACTYRPPHVAVLLNHLRRAYAFPASAGQISGLYRRNSGDMAEGGRGEVLHWTGE